MYGERLGNKGKYLICKVTVCFYGKRTQEKIAKMKGKGVNGP